MDEIQFKWCRLEDLSGAEVHGIIAARETVFVFEQNCAYQEADSFDVFSWHLIAYKNTKIAGYLRVVDPGHKYAEPSIGRVLTLKEFRGTGLGKRLVEVGIGRAQEVFPGLGLRISAQLYLKKFYEQFGFCAVSNEYMEDNIPHIEMTLSY